MTDPIGYTYKTEAYCVGCMRRYAMNRVVNNTVNVEDYYTAEHLLELWAIIDGIHRKDETTFDSGEFPKVILDRVDLSCGTCGTNLGTGEEYLCPACGYAPDYCNGHGFIGDPRGWRTLFAHDHGDHAWCRAGCADV